MVNQRHGMSYSLVARLSGGFQSGAYEISDHARRAVLKWSANPGWAVRVHRAAELVARARAVGYPTPAWLAVGELPDGTPYQVQEFVEGTPQDRLGPIGADLAGQLIDLVGRGRGLVGDRDYNWSDYVRRVVFDGWSDTWSTVASYDERAAALIARFDASCAPHRHTDLPLDDLVHGDLSAGNLIVADGRIVAVIDIEAASGGSRAYDLTVLTGMAVRDSAEPGVEGQLLAAALSAGGTATVTVSAAAAFAELARFVHDRNPDHLDVVYQGAERLLDLLSA